MIWLTIYHEPNDCRLQNCPMKPMPAKKVLLLVIVGVLNAEGKQ
jgi:hypothetical protein